MTLVVDTGGLLSVLDGKQDDHELFVEAVRTAPGPLLVSPLVPAELDHLILARYGRQAELAAIEEIEAAYQVERIGDEDLARSCALLSRYADLGTFGCETTYEDLKRRSERGLEERELGCETTYEDLDLSREPSDTENYKR